MQIAKRVAVAVLAVVTGLATVSGVVLTSPSARAAGVVVPRCNRGFALTLTLDASRGLLSQAHWSMLVSYFTASPWLHPQSWQQVRDDAVLAFPGLRWVRHWPHYPALFRYLQLESGHGA